MSDDARLGFGPQALASEALRQELLIRSLLLTVRTAVPVKVLAVHPGEGSPPAIGTVDVQPLVQTVDGSGNLWAMSEVYGVPFMRIQAGGTAIVVDPAVNDIGLAVACDRDISGVLASGGQQSGPGSARTHHVSDLVYALSIISAAKITQYILADASGITVVSPNVTMNTVTVDPEGDVDAPGSVTSGSGASGTFTSSEGQVITVLGGLIVNIY